MTTYNINIDYQEDASNTPDSLLAKCRIVKVEAKDFDEALKIANEQLSTAEQDDLNRSKGGSHLTITENDKRTHKDCMFDTCTVCNNDRRHRSRNKKTNQNRILRSAIKKNKVDIKQHDTTSQSQHSSLLNHCPTLFKNKIFRPIITFPKKGSAQPEHYQPLHRQDHRPSWPNRGGQK